MPSPDRTSADQVRLTDDDARQLLARASELDVARGRTLSLAQVREAAHEAGISSAAFDLALSELESRAVLPAAATATPMAGRTPRQARHARVAVFTLAFAVLGAGLLFARAATQPDAAPAPALDERVEVTVSTTPVAFETRIDTVVVELPRAQGGVVEQVRTPVQERSADLPPAPPAPR